MHSNNLGLINRIVILWVCCHDKPTGIIAVMINEHDLKSCKIIMFAVFGADCHSGNHIEGFRNMVLYHIILKTHIFNICHFLGSCSWILGIGCFGNQKLKVTFHLQKNIEPKKKDKNWDYHWIIWLEHQSNRLLSQH